MGCINNRNELYYNPEYFTEEKNIRKWEFNLGIRNKSFFEIVSSINSKIMLEGEEILTEKFESFINSNFANKDVLNLFESNIFKLKNKVDCKNVKLMFLLLSSSEVIPSPDDKTQSIDKVEFLINLVNDFSGEELRREDIEILIEPIFIFACETIPICYLNSKHHPISQISNEEKYLLKLKNFIMPIKNRYFDAFFGGDSKISISITELNEKFIENPYVRILS